MAETRNRIPPDYPLARHIDQTILKPSATAHDIKVFARRAAELGVASCCVPPWAVPDAAAVLKGSGTAVQTVIGFPLGFQSGEVKVFEARKAVESGADEIDMVINRGFVRSGEYRRMADEVRAVVDACFPTGVKTILEISDLGLNEILDAVSHIMGTGAVYVKTSTGFFGTGADLAIVRAIVRQTGSRIKIKASGGIRDLASAWGFIQAGADRIGTSSGEAILAEFASSGTEKKG